MQLLRQIFCLGTWLGSVRALECSKDVMLAEQADADELQQCKYGFNADITISSSAKGALHIDGVNKIMGTLSIAAGSLIEHLSCSAEYVHVLNISMTPSLQSLRFHNMTSARTLLLDNLTNLETMDAPNLTRTSNLSWTSLPKLERIQLATQFQGASEKGRITVEGVGLGSIDSLLDLGEIDEISISDVPNVNMMRLNIKQARSVAIRGNGNLTVGFDNREIKSVKNITSLSLSGIREVNPFLGLYDGPALYVDSFIFENNSATDMYGVLDAHRHIRIANNPYLERIHFSLAWGASDWDTITIENNPKLKLTSTADFQPDATKPSTTIGQRNTTSSKWFWSGLRSNTTILRGFFDNAFFEPFTSVESPFSGFDLPIVRDRLVVDSTAGDVNCSALRALQHEDGSIRGVLECQGETFSRGHRASPLLGTALIILGLSICIQV